MASTAATPPLKQRSVVSCFIVKYPEPGGTDKPLVALFKRSSEVNTYKHHLAPISGSIDINDASPLAAAWRELREETTLTESSLELLRQGKSYSFSDESIGREWLIYPFAFRLKTGEASIRIDWEHESWDWHDPLEVEDNDAFGGVPRLAESLRRVWFEKDLGTGPGAILAEGLEQLKNDHQSGARQLAGVALTILKDTIVAMDSSDSSNEWWVKVRFAAWHLWKNGRESMGSAIIAVLLDSLKSIEETLRQHTEHPGSKHSMKWKDSVLEDLKRRIALRDNASSAMPLIGAFVAHIKGRFASRLDSRKPLSILTLSGSSTISQCLRHVILQTEFSLDLRILESRPLFEGVSLAGWLTSEVLSSEASSQGELYRNDGLSPSKTKVTIYTDASAALAADGVDIILIGSDRIASSGAVSNKTGSLPAILSAKQVSPSVKTVVLSESEKVAAPGEPSKHVIEDNDPKQLMRAWESDFNSDRVRNAAARMARVIGDGDSGGFDGVRVQLRNIFFEWVPPELIDVYITEYGIWTVEDIAKHSRRLGAEEERLFGNM